MYKVVFDKVRELLGDSFKIKSILCDFECAIHKGAKQVAQNQ